MNTLANERDLTELQRRFAALCGDEPPRFGTMSPSVAVCHVRQAYRWALEGRPGTFPFNLPFPKVVIKKAALSMPMKWRPGLKTVRELEPGQPGTIPADFAADTAETLAAMSHFRDTVGVTAAPPEHAFFGPMTRADWLRWGYLHADHHLRQFGR